MSRTAITVKRNVAVKLGSLMLTIVHPLTITV